MLGLHLVLFAPGSLSRRENAALVLLIAFAAATHSATLAVLMAVVAVAGLLRLSQPDLVPIRALGGSVAAMDYLSPARAFPAIDTTLTSRSPSCKAPQRASSKDGATTFRATPRRSFPRAGATILSI